MYPSPTPPSSIKRSRYRFETPQLSRRLAPASIENQATKVAPSGKNSLHETGGSFELNNNDNTGDTFYFRNAMGREAKQWTVQPHTRRTERKRSSKALYNQTTKVTPGGKNSLHVRGVHQAEQHCDKTGGTLSHTIERRSGPSRLRL